MSMIIDGYRDVTVKLSGGKPKPPEFNWGIFILILIILLLGGAYGVRKARKR